MRVLGWFLVLACLIASPASTQVGILFSGGSAVQFPATFQGNDYAIVSAISPTGVGNTTITAAGSGGSTSATKTWASGDLNTTTDQIAITGHGFSTGQSVMFRINSGTAPGTSYITLPGGQNYFLNAVDADHVTMHTTYDLAVAGTKAMPFTTAGSGTYQFEDHRIYWNVATTCVSCAGTPSGAQLNIWAEGGAVVYANIRPSYTGSGYAVGDIITVANTADIGGITGFQLRVDSVGIMASRSGAQPAACNMPCFVHVDATSFAATGVIVDHSGTTLPQFSVDPYSDIEYSWDFGDTTGTETFTNPYPYGGASVNANRDQHGPQAVYVYRTTGTKTITVYARAKRSTTPDDYITSSQTFQVTVSNFATVTGGNEYWFDSNASCSDPGTCNGTLANPYKDGTRFKTLSATPGRTFHIKLGSSFSISQEYFSPPNSTATYATGIRVDTCIDSACSAQWGSGANPILASTFIAVPLNAVPSNTARNIWDLVFSNIDFRVTAASTFACQSITDRTTATYGIFAFYNTVRHVYWDRSTCTTVNTTGDDMGFSSAIGVGMWGGNVTGSTAAGAVANRSRIASGAREWHFLVGVGPISGNGGSSTDGSHITYPAGQEFHMLYRWVTTGTNTNSNTTIHQRNLGWAYHAWNIGGWINVVENGFYGGVKCGLCVGNGANSQGVGVLPVTTNPENEALGQPSAIVYERNRLTALSVAINNPNGVNGINTFRDNYVYSNTGGSMGFPNPNLSTQYQGRTYRNKFYGTVADLQQHYIVNGNNDFGVSAPWTVPQFYVDNEIYVTAASVLFAWVIGTTNQPIGSGGIGTYINGNTYIAPNEANDLAWQTEAGGTARGFSAGTANWQSFGFDLNGTYSKTPPCWLDPANGNFNC